MQVSVNLTLVIEKVQRAWKTDFLGVRMGGCEAQIPCLLGSVWLAEDQTLPNYV